MGALYINCFYLTYMCLSGDISRIIKFGGATGASILRGDDGKLGISLRIAVLSHAVGLGWIQRSCSTCLAIDRC